MVQIAHNAVIAKLIGATREEKLEVQRLISYKVAGSEHMPAFASGGWDGRSSFFDFVLGTFPRGFVTLVTHGLQKIGSKVQIVKNPYPEPLGPLNPVVDAFPEDLRYDYQPKVIEVLLRHGQVIAQVATGGGKSRIAKLATARICRKTLFLTTRGVLMYQMATSFRELKKQVAILGDGSLEISKDITCGMVQTIISWLKDPDLIEDPVARARQEKRRAKMIEALGTFEFVILEEAHEVSGNSFYEIMRHCKNAHYRLALTATPFMKDDEEANMRLMAVAGPIAIRVSEELLIQRGILAKPYFKYIKIAEHPKKLFRSTPWQRAVEVGVVENELRNKHIVAECIRAKRFGLSTLVLVQRKDHGKLLAGLLERSGVRATYIFGEDDQTERTRALRALKDKTIDVLIGSTILDVGVDVPAIGMVILAGGGKAEVALRQRIGRGLREKKDGSPNVCFVIDFVDGFNNHLKQHAATRRSIVESIKGFRENIVANDFDFAGLGLKRAA